jgi:hypothetical protein
MLVQPRKRTVFPAAQEQGRKKQDDWKLTGSPEVHATDKQILSSLIDVRFHDNIAIVRRIGFFGKPAGTVEHIGISDRSKRIA